MESQGEFQLGSQTATGQSGEEAGIDDARDPTPPSGEGITGWDQVNSAVW